MLGFVFFEDFGDGLDGFRRAGHSDFYGVDVDVVENGGELLF